MKRFLILAIAGAFAGAASGCYEPAYIPPKPTPAEIVRENAAAVIGKTFAGKADLKANLAKFLEKLGEATTTAQLHAAWEEVYPGYPNVVYKTISKSLVDFYWPVAPVTDGRVFVEGFRAAAEELSGSSDQGKASRREELESIAHLLEQAYMAFYEGRFDKTIKHCEAVIAIDPHYTVAVELKEDAQKARHRAQ